MRLSATLLGLLCAATASAQTTGAGATPASEADPELEILATSLQPEQRKAVDEAVGGLASLPRYRLDLELDTTEQVLRGRQQLSILAREELSELYFRIPANAPFAGDGDAQAAVEIKGVQQGSNALALEPEAEGVYRLRLEPAVRAGERLELELRLEAHVPDLSEAALRPDAQLMQQAMAFVGSAGDGGSESQSDFGVFGRAGTTYNLAGFFPELVRRESGIPDLSPEPGRGEPRWGPLACYTVSLVAPFAMQVAGSGTEIGQTPEKDGRKRTTRVAAAVRGFALVAGEGWKEQKATSGKVRLRALAPEGQAEQARKLLDVATRAIGLFSEKLCPYPWADLELVAAPLTEGIEALSYPGLLLVSPLLSDPGTAASMTMLVPNPVKTTDSVLELAIAHQVSHQWWRGIVGSDSLQRPALAEPLATFSAVLYVERRRGAKAGAQALRSQVRDAYRIYRMLGAPDRPVDRPIGEYQGRGEISGLLGGKGAFFYDRLRKLLGEKAFASALKRAAREGYFKEVETDPVLLAAASLAPGKAQAALKLHERYVRQLHGDEDVGKPYSLAEALKSSGFQVDPATAALLNQVGAALSGGVSVDQPPAGNQGP